MVRANSTASGADQAKGESTSTVELLALLVEVDRGLEQATNEDDILMAVVRCAERHRPASVELRYVVHEDHGRPDGMEIVAAWADGALFPNHPLRNVRMKLDPRDGSSFWYSSPLDALLVEDVTTDLRVDDVFRTHFVEQARKRAIVLLPLYNTKTKRWHGFLTMTWTEPHAASAEEMLVYTLLSSRITAAITGKRDISSQQALLRETSRQQIALETILENLNVGVILVDLATFRTILMNRAAMELLATQGATENFDSVASRNVVFHPGASEPMPREEWPLMRAIASGQAVRDEMDILRHDGVRLAVDIVATPIRDENRKFMSAMFMFQDLRPLRRAEEERIQMQEELIRAQAAALVERSTPLIPISDEIVVTPIIGSIDMERGKLMLEALLQGVSRSNARFAIIDVTGVPTIDAQAAGALTGAARALRLLGVEPVFTGLRPEVALMLVGLGVDLGGIATLGTLESGIAYASRTMGRRTV